jgi:hypothetical protein
MVLYMGDLLLHIGEGIWWLIRKLIGLEHRRQVSQRVVKNWHITLIFIIVIACLTILWRAVH